MRYLVTAFLFISCIGNTSGQHGNAVESDFKQYYFVMLTKGEVRNQDSATTAKIQEGHLANITRMANEGKCIIAGPFGDDGNWRGILILDVATEQDARNEIEKDPAVIAKRLSYEIHPWWTMKRKVEFK